jgi:hypothetical protein
LNYLRVSSICPKLVVITPPQIDPCNGTEYLIQIDEPWLTAAGSAAADVQSLDRLPPVTGMMPLERYTRRADFALDWVGVDQGISGIQKVEFEYRTDSNPVWRNADSLVQFGMFRLPQEKFYLRSRGIDNAGNIEAWPASNDGDAATRAFEWSLSGRISDGRGLPLVNLNLALMPFPIEISPTDSNGEFRALTESTGDHVLNNTSRFQLYMDWTRTLYQIPSDNVIQQGGFEETTLTTWQAEPSTSAVITTEQPAVGVRSLWLGENCIGPCLQESITAARPLAGSQAQTAASFPFQGKAILLMDETNRSYAVGWANNSLQFSSSNDGATWAPPIPLVNGTQAIGLYDATLDRANNLHVAWVIETSNLGRTTGTIYYVRRTASNGVWSAPMRVGEGVTPRLAVSEDHVHLLYVQKVQDQGTETVSLRHRAYASDVGWSAETVLQTFDKSRYYTPSDLYQDYALVATVDIANNLHIVWSRFSNDRASTLSYQPRSSDGKWAPITGMAFRGIPLKLFYGRENQVHLVWSSVALTANSIFYSQRGVDGRWTPAEAVLATDSHYGNMISQDRGDGIHVLSVYSPPAVGERFAGFYYRSRGVNGKWQESHNLKLAAQWFSNYTTLAAGSANVLRLYQAESNKVFSTIQLTQAISASLSQSVTIPLNMHKPTLSFLYALEGASSPKSYMSVIIRSELSGTVSSTAMLEATPGAVQVSSGEVFSAALATPWQLGWADLSAWQGQTITVTFSVYNAAGDPPLRLILDEVAIGSWRTPRPIKATPSRLEYGVVTEVVIEGENFMRSGEMLPSVKLGEQAVNTIRWIDEQHLLIAIPSTLQAGVYPVFVTNPSGESAPMSSALLIGKPTHLPIVQYGR